MHSKWRTRAEIVNGKEHTPGRKSLQERTRELFRMKERLPLRYHFLFKANEEQTLAQESKPLRAWLHLTEPVITRAHEREIRLSKKKTSLEKWMGVTYRIRGKGRRGNRRKLVAWEARRRHQRKRT